MPLYRFFCDPCAHEESKLLPTSKRNTEVFCPACDKKMVQTIGATSVLGKVTNDEYRGKSVDENIRSKLDERASEHFIRHDLPRIIATHGKEHAIKEGYIDVEGRPIRKRK